MKPSRLFSLSTILALSAISTLPVSAEVGDQITDSQGLVYNILAEPSGDTPGTCEVGDNNTYSISDNIAIPSTVSFGDNLYNVVGIAPKAFYYCSALISADLSDCTTLQTIGEQSFKGCFNLTSVDLTGCKSLSSIGNNAFDMVGNSDNLITVNLSGCIALQTIGNHAFYECWKLPSVDLTDCNSLQTIGDYAFFDGSSLEEIKFPKSLQNIGHSAFMGCRKLENIYCYAVTPPGIYFNTFASLNSATLWVPQGSIEVYRDDEYWGNAKKIRFIIEVPISDITLDFNDFTMAQNAEPVQITATVYPEDASFPELEWTLSEEAIVQIIPSENSSSTIQIKPLAAGEVTLTSTSIDGSGTNASCKITVISLTGVEIGSTDSGSSDWTSIMTNGATLRVGQTLPLAVRTTPAVDFAPAVTWSTASPAIASVTPDSENSLNGTLKGVAIGKTTLTVSAGDLLAMADITVIAENPITSLSPPSGG